MKKEKDHNEQVPSNNGLEELSDLTIPWSKPKEEIWSALEARIDKDKEAPVIPLYHYRKIMTLAASLLLVLTLGSVVWFYTTNIQTTPGNRFLATLPDGSQVTLNAGSSLTYRPLLWPVLRKINFEGEGYFDIARGSRFEVYSAKGTTTIHGTSFNIYSREDQYTVTCISGEVQVENAQGDRVILHADEKAVYSAGQNLVKQVQVNTSVDLAWLENKFIFTAAPLEDVMKEIERQYAVQIELTSIPQGLIYTGNFSAEKTVEETLDLVCTPFGLKFATTKAGSYQISNND
ncbi:MAG: FecR domain-containing protein [Cyclobacteriaceae bacterium]|nr:FecR domain-containing protein [Cyclobacteriaceae bacterium]